jgi:rRNA maturation RNase YbeY
MLLLRITQRTVPLKRDYLYENLGRALRFLEKQPGLPVALSGVTAVDAAVWCASDATVRKLNAKYRQRSRVTDVLAFGFAKPPQYVDQSRGGITVADLGTVVIATPFLYRRYRRVLSRGCCSEMFDVHVLKTAVHGLCHLFGYCDETEEQSKIMTEIEQRVHEALGIAGTCSAPV